MGYAIDELIGLLYGNQIIPADQVVTVETLAIVQMPNGDSFVPDPQPEIG